ncbi:hypothetical protein ABK040_006768 [Willaertia magna]
MARCSPSTIMCCCSCCAVYSFVSLMILCYIGILIAVSAYPFSEGVNDHVYHSKKYKAQGCFIAAAIYGAFVVLGVVVTVALYFKKKRD